MRDPRVRRALSLAIDREGIVKNVMRGGQIPAHFFTPPDTAGYTARARMPTDFDAARRLLVEAGHPDGQGLPPVDILINTSGNHRAVAEVVQQTWRDQLHVNANIRNEEFKVYLDTQRALNYQVCRAAWIGDYPDPFTFLGIFVSTGEQNFSGWKNAEYDRLLAASQSAAPAERMEDFQRLEKILLDEGPVAPIYFYTNVYLLRPSVKGWYSNILNRHMPKFLSLDESAATADKGLPAAAGARRVADAAR